MKAVGNSRVGDAINFWEVSTTVRGIGYYRPYGAMSRLRCVTE